MPINLGDLGVMYSSKEVKELRKQDQAEIKKLKADMKMLEEKISRPHLAKFSPGSLQSDQIPAGNLTFLFISQLSMAVDCYGNMRDFVGGFEKCSL